MLSKRQAFKVGFMRKCANEGMTPEETHQVVREALSTVKEAGITDLLTKPYNTIVDVGGEALKGVGNAGLAGLALGPPIIGGALGLLAAKAGDIDTTDVNAVKKRELIDEYRRQTEILERKKRQRQL